ncbi:MAG: DUF1634 domain-containing protein [Terriglobales bacterium]
MPTQPEEKERDKNVYAAVYHALLYGMIASSALFAVGLIRGMLLHTYFPLTEQWITDHYHWKVVMHGIATADPTVLMMIACVLLILTPVVRVVVSIIAFAQEGDRKYVLVTSVVLAVIVLSILLGHEGLH